MKEIEILEAKLKIKKMDAHIDEMELNKLKLAQKIEKLDKEIALQQEAINEKKQLIKELEQGE